MRKMPDVREVLPVGLTMRAAHQVALASDQAFIKARELVEAHFQGRQSLSLAARKMLNLFIAKAAGDAWAETTHQITKKELRGSHKSNDRLSAILDELMQAKFKVVTKSIRGKDAVLTAAIISWNIEERDEDGLSLIQWQFSDPARHLFQASDHYARLSRQTMLQFKSKYALSIYELGCLAQARRIKRYSSTISEIRLLLGIPPESFRNFADFRRDILHKSKTEIDQLCEFTFSWIDKRQRGNKYSAIDLCFQDKGQRTDIATSQRLATLLTAEQSISSDLQFPSGSLHFGSLEEYFGEIAVRFGGNWDRDILAEKYRAYLGDKLNKLKGQRLVKSFEGFCKSYAERHGEAP
jgi:hypothetical protein